MRADADVQVATEPAGRQGRLADLYARHAQGAAEMAYMLTGDRHLAEDLAHDAFIRVAGRFHHLRNEEAFPTYLRRTVVNLFLNSARRKKLERSYLEQVARAPAPESVMPDLDTRDQLWAALGRIPPRQRAVLVLRYYEVLFTDGIDVKAVAHAGRTISAPLRTALVQMYPTCGVCDERHGLEIDHIVPFAEGGPTTKDNLARLCEWHHMLRSIHSYRLVGTLGNWTLVGPDPPKG